MNIVKQARNTIVALNNKEARETLDYVAAKYIGKTRFCHQVNSDGTVKVIWKD